MKAYDQIAARIVAKAEITKKTRVLEVGSDLPGGLALELSKYAGEIVGTNLLGKPRTLAPNCQIVIDDIRSSKFPTGKFDAVVSHAAFEHIGSFDQALDEMFRVLKPGGILYSSFGPIWSCAWGHHLWVPWAEGSINYVNTPLPAYCHLLMDEKSLLAYLSRKKIDAKAAPAIVEFVFHSQEQNRLMHDDYARAFARSKFSLREWTSIGNKQLEVSYGGLPKPSVVKELRSKYPQNGEFSASAITVLARAPV